VTGGNDGAHLCDIGGTHFAGTSERTSGAELRQKRVERSARLGKRKLVERNEVLKCSAATPRRQSSAERRACSTLKPSTAVWTYHVANRPPGNDKVVAEIGVEQKRQRGRKVSLVNLQQRASRMAASRLQRLPMSGDC